MKIVISSGHGKLVRGATGFIDEVDEARNVVDKVATELRDLGAEVETFHDDTSTSQSENLETIVSFHNQCTRDLDVSVHFNAFEITDAPMGTECLYVTQEDLAEEVASTLAGAAGFIERGAKCRNDLYFLNNTDEAAILIEVCFVDSKADTDLYRAHFATICSDLARVLAEP